MMFTYGEIRDLFPNNNLQQNDSECCQGFCRDSRSLKKNEIYVAIRGDRFDGHLFVEDAFGKGAIAALVARTEPDRPQLICVPDTVVALGQLGKAYRQKFSQPLIAITGSNGKTTTKELLTHVLRQSGPVGATQGNLNNHIGVPVTILNFEPTDRFFVVEMGMNHWGEIAQLAKIAKPTLALITSVGHAHLEGVGNTIEGVARAKSELFANLSPQATALVFNDCPHISKMASPAQRVTYGFGPNSDIWAGAISTKGSQTHFDIHEGTQVNKVTIAMTGRHHVQNALAVYATARQAGLSPELIVSGLKSFVLSGSRGQAKVFGGITVINDTYNANPDSMAAAFASLAAAYPHAHKIAALGGMRELGEQSQALHHATGTLAKKTGIDDLFVFGEHGDQALAGFGYPQTESDSHWFCDHTKMAEQLLDRLSNLSGEIVVLCKGSRGMTMEKVLEALEEGLKKRQKP